MEFFLEFLGYRPQTSVPTVRTSSKQLRGTDMDTQRPLVEPASRLGNLIPCPISATPDRPHGPPTP